MYAGVVSAGSRSWMFLWQLQPWHAQIRRPWQTACVVKQTLHRYACSHNKERVQTSKDQCKWTTSPRSHACRLSYTVTRLQMNTNVTSSFTCWEFHVFMCHLFSHVELLIHIHMLSFSSHIFNYKWKTVQFTCDIMLFSHVKTFICEKNTLKTVTTWRSGFHVFMSFLFSDVKILTHMCKFPFICEKESLQKKKSQFTCDIIFFHVKV